MSFELVFSQQVAELIVTEDKIEETLRRMIYWKIISQSKVTTINC